MSAFPIPLHIAARRLGVTPRTAQDPAWREREKLVDVPQPGPGPVRVWLAPDSVERAAALRAAITQAVHQK